MAAPRLSRRQFVLLSSAAALGVGGYALTRAVRRVREAARHSSDL
jgi:hypothetical protein